eukprot:scaffold16102_cov62-Phaeocystis_antarctica.AAC.2
MPTCEGESSPAASTPGQGVGVSAPLSSSITRAASPALLLDSASARLSKARFQRVSSRPASSPGLLYGLLLGSAGLGFEPCVAYSAQPAR